MKTTNRSSPACTQLPTVLQLADYCSQFILNHFRFETAGRRSWDRQGRQYLLGYARRLLRNARFKRRELMSTVICALLLLDRLKRERDPNILDARGLFTVAVTVAHKCISEESYSLRTWSDIVSTTFTPRELNKFERHMCAALDWRLNFDPIAFRRLEHRILNADNLPLTLVDSCSVSDVSDPDERSCYLPPSAVPAISHSIVARPQLWFAPWTYVAPPPFVVPTFAGAPALPVWVLSWTHRDHAPQWLACLPS